MQNFTRKIRVRYAETDQMGMVYHGNYALYLEETRVEWLRALGISYKEMENTNTLLPVVSMNFSFKASARYDDVLSVNLQLEKTPGVKLELTYTIKNQNQELLTTAATTLVFVNKKTGRPMRCPDYVLQAIYGSNSVIETP